MSRIASFRPRCDAGHLRAVVVGIPAERLADLADDEGAELIVVGSRGRAVQSGVSRQRLEQPGRHRTLPGTDRPARRRHVAISTPRVYDAPGNGVVLGVIATVDEQAREPVSFLVFSASLREGSLNTRLAELAAAAIESKGGTVDLGSMAEFDCPSYNADLQVAEGFPPGADELRGRLEASDAFVICSPEYNASMPGVLKNAVDWVSRFHPQPFHERHALLLSASPSMVGGNRGVWALRVPFEHLGARIYPDMFSLARAHLALDEDGQIADEELRRRFEMTIASFMDLVEASKHYPCVKSAWVEYLGEHPEPAIDRVQ